MFGGSSERPDHSLSLVSVHIHTQMQQVFAYTTNVHSNTASKRSQCNEEKGESSAGI